MRIVVLLALVTLACGSSLGNYKYAEEPDPRNKELTLGVGDVIVIDVWDQKDLKTEGTIRPDGTITMPLVGDLIAAGQTPTQLKAKIKEALTSFLKQGGGNEITVAVKAWKSYRFTLEGEVGKPGVYTSDQFVTVGEAIAMGSGLTRFANRGGIKLLRTGQDGKLKQIPLDYDLLASGKRPDMNIYVLPGDTIWVP
jgi:polysaccharide export outer membrane protein